VLGVLDDEDPEPLSRTCGRGELRDGSGSQPVSSSIHRGSVSPRAMRSSWSACSVRVRREGW